MTTTPCTTTSTPCTTTTTRCTTTSTPCTTTTTRCTTTSTPCCGEESETDQVVLVKPDVWAWASSGKGRYDEEDRDFPHSVGFHRRSLQIDGDDTSAKKATVSTEYYDEFGDLAWDSHAEGAYEHDSAYRPPRRTMTTTPCTTTSTPCTTTTTRCTTTSTPCTTTTTRCATTLDAMLRGGV